MELLLKKTTKVSIFYSSITKISAWMVQFMSSINNIPFDINRTAVEKNATVKKGGTVPVQQSELVHEIEKNIPVKERRNTNRRKRPKKAMYDKRFRDERRKTPKEVETKSNPLEKVHKSGHLIDLEV